MNSQEKSNPNKKVLYAALALLGAAAVLLGIWRVAVPKPAEGEKNILVRVIHAGGGEAAFPIQTRQDYLGFALVEAGVVEDNQSTYGLYILTADGETADEGNQEWWKVTKSGEMVNTGADQTPIADGDAFELTLTVGYDG